MELRDGSLELLGLGSPRRELILEMGYGLIRSVKQHVHCVENLMPEFGSRDSGLLGLVL